MRYGKIKDWVKSGVAVGNDIDPSRISDHAILLPGTRIRGRKTSIGPGCVVGAEGPVTIDNCQLGREVSLKGGYFAGATFLDRSNMGLGAHVRAGTILEEEANGAHTVGLKQTILLPFVTLGSLINFCDVLMAGGTSRKDHSEVGSSYVHFNFTPHQDKATASLIGDVARGVFLDQNPIFLGGQGGLVGPARVAYGSVIAAGGVCREDILVEDQLHVPETPPSGTRPYQTGVYRRSDRLIRNNLNYIGNLRALRSWYRSVRSKFVRDAFDGFALEGALENLDAGIEERIKRLGAVADKFVESADALDAKGVQASEVATQRRFAETWPVLREKLEAPSEDAAPEWVAALSMDLDYLDAVRALDDASKESGRAWLNSTVEAVVNLWEND